MTEPDNETVEVTPVAPSDVTDAPVDASPVPESEQSQTIPDLDGVPVDDKAEPANAEVKHEATDAQVQGEL